MILAPEQLRHAKVLADFLRQQPDKPEVIQLAESRALSCADWLEQNFWIPVDGGRPRLIKLLPHQKVILHLFFDPLVAQLLLEAETAQTLVFSTVKKSGKTAIAAGVARWVTETWGTHVETYSLANDLEQARGRIYAAALASIELDPRYSRPARGIPDRWRIIEREAAFLPTHSALKAVSSDYKGEAGSNPVATFWSELWGYSSEASQRLWEELTPVPTRPRSIRYVETYAGYDGESSILNELEDKIKTPKLGSRRLELDELRVLLQGSGLEWPKEWESQPLPFFVHKASRTIAYWDQGVEARRMPWQTPAYYIAQQSDLRKSAFDRLHLNIRVTSTEQFIPKEWWERLKIDDMPPIGGESIVVGADASVTGDCSGLVAVSRDIRKGADPDHLLVRRASLWQPADGRPLNYSLTIEPTLRQWITGHIHPLREKCDSHNQIERLGICVPVKPMNVVQVAYDEFQLHDMMTRLRDEGLTWCRKFGQQADRSVADKQLYDVIRNQHIHHDGDEDLAEHIVNCGAKVPVGDNTRLRLVKKAEKSKIDLAVATSMAGAECKRLNLT